MMSSNNPFSKPSIYDARVVQTASSFQVIKGAMNVNNQKVSALTKSSSSQNYNITIPSLNVSVDRKINWESEAIIKVTLTANSLNGAQAPAVNGNPAEGTNIVTLGENLSLNSYPLHRMVSTMSLTLNDAVVTTNLADSLDEQIYLMDADSNEKINQTFPSYFGEYKNYKDGRGAHNNPITGRFDRGDNSKPKNGAWFDVDFCLPNGDPVPLGADEPVQIDGTTYRFDNGKPSYFDAPDGTIETVYKFCLKFRCIEPLMISPLQYTYEYGQTVGLYGINNMSLNINFGDLKNCLSFDNTTKRTLGPGVVIDGVDTISNVSFSSSNPFKVARLNINYLTPPLDLQLSQNNVVPYYDFATSKTNHSGLAANIASGTINSSTITLPSIPDCLIVGVKKQTYTSEETHHYIPIKKVNLTFDNRSGLLNTLDSAELYQMSYKNGLKADYSQWRGVVNTPNKGKLESIGGFVIAKFGTDIELNPGQAPSVLGNYSLSMQVQFERPIATAATGPLQLVIICPSSGFLQTQSGSSRIVKNLLTESDVMNAPMSGTDENINRYIGGSFFSKLSSGIHSVGNTLKDIVKNKDVQKAALDIGKEVLVNSMKKGKGMYRTKGMSGGEKTKLSSLL